MGSIAVLDYGMGNLHSIAKALEQVSDRQRVVVTYDAKELERASRIVFPGVGGIQHCVDELRRMHLDDTIRQVIQEKPVLCICIGMQSLMDFSEENNGSQCLGIFDGEVKRFPNAADPDTGSALKIPHMGWNKVHQTQDHPIWEGIADGERFYFVHSYYVQPKNDSLVYGTSEYPHEFCCSIAQGNLFAVQFHPEKSANAGLKLLSNFVRWDGEEK